MTEKVYLTKTQKQIFDIVERNAKEGRKTTLAEIIHETRHSPTYISQNINGDKRHNLKGLAEKVPPIKDWIHYKKGQGKGAIKIEVDPSFFYENKGGK